MLNDKSAQGALYFQNFCKIKSSFLEQMLTIFKDNKKLDY
jgi:hypothetical protein